MKITRSSHDLMTIAIKFENKIELCNLWNRLYLSDSVVEASIIKDLQGMKIPERPFQAYKGNNFILWSAINDMIKDLEK